MKGKCFEIGVIQAFLDGELAPDVSQNVVRHVALCDDCAVLMDEAEDETAVAFGALENTLNPLIPTQRLWLKINESIKKKEESFWEKIYVFAVNPFSVGFASLLILFVIFTGILHLQKNDTALSSVRIDRQNEPKNDLAADVQEFTNEAAKMFRIEQPKQKNGSDTKGEKINYEVRNTAFVQPKPEKKSIKKIKRQSDISNPSPKVKSPDIAENLSGEDSYLKTIEILSKTVDSRKDAALKPSARFDFEKDLAVINDAIGKMQTALKRNPKDEAAKEMLRSSYQNKIDLLSSVSEKSELMASLK